MLLEGKIQVPLTQADEHHMTETHQAQALLAIEQAFIKFDRHFGRTFVRPQVRFDLRGKTAGYAHQPYSGKPGYIRVNVELLSNPEYTEEMLKQTLPHEVAHIVQYQLYPTRQCKSHGPEWRSLMGVLGIPARRTHSMKTTPARGTSNPYVYRAYCACSEPHLISSRRLANMRRGRRYYCKRCRQDLSLQPQNRAA